jgi:hypothetical protein
MDAAFLAGLATGVCKDLTSVADRWSTVAVFAPSMASVRRAALVVDGSGPSNARCMSRRLELIGGIAQNPQSVAG